MQWQSAIARSANNKYLISNSENTFGTNLDMSEKPSVYFLYYIIQG